MLIGHVAIYTDQLENLRDFYTTYFGASSTALYENPQTGFSSYFLNFDDGGAMLEIMRRPHIVMKAEGGNLGYAHLSMSAGSTSAVDLLTETLRKDGYSIIKEPRFTGDGFYESAVLDPDGNEVEITV